MQNLLTYIIFLPLLGGILIFFYNREKIRAIKVFGIALSVLTFILSLFLYFGFDVNNPAIQFQHKVLWISGLNISSRSFCIIAFTEPYVPTGINAGVWKIPWSVIIFPARALASICSRTNCTKLIY